MLEGQGHQSHFKITGGKRSLLAESESEAETTWSAAKWRKRRPEIETANK